MVPRHMQQVEITTKVTDTIETEMGNDKYLSQIDLLN